MEDKFPDEFIFAVFTKTSWYANIANYLATRELPFHLSPREKRSIIQNNTCYTWINKDFFKTRLDLIIKRCVREDEMLEI